MINSQRLNPSLVADVDRGIMVTIKDKTTMQAFINTNFKSQLLNGQTPAITARLGCVLGINSYDFHTGTLSLVLEDRKEFPPTGIVGRLSKVQ